MKDVSPYFPKVATHSSILAWRIPWTEEPGGLRSRGSPRAGHKRSDLAHMHACRRQTKHPNPVSSLFPSAFLLHCAASLFIKYISDSVYSGEVYNLSRNCSQEVCGQGEESDRSINDDKLSGK